MTFFNQNSDALRKNNKTNSKKNKNKNNEINTIEKVDIYLYQSIAQPNFSASRMETRFFFTRSEMSKNRYSN